MDADLIVWLLVMAFWVVSSLLGRLTRKKENAKRPAQEVPDGKGGGFLERMVRDLAEAQREMLQPAQPPQQVRPGEDGGSIAEQKRLAAERRRLMRRAGLESSEHQETAGEHTETPGEHRRTFGESLITAEEHRVSRSEHVPTASEHLRTFGEHRGTLEEHLPGDLPVKRKRKLAAVPGSRETASRVRSKIDVLHDLHGPRDLARAIVLREVLGPPVALRDPQDDRSG